MHFLALGTFGLSQPLFSKTDKNKNRKKVEKNPSLDLLCIPRIKKTKPNLGLFLFIVSVLSSPLTWELDPSTNDGKRKPRILWSALPAWRSASVNVSVSQQLHSSFLGGASDYPGELGGFGHRCRLLDHWLGF
jgi:hypothetical protein